MSFTRDRQDARTNREAFDPQSEPVMPTYRDPGRERAMPGFGSDEHISDPSLGSSAYGNQPVASGPERYGGTPMAWRDRLVVETLQRLFRHRFLCLALVAAAALSGGAATLFMDPYYIASGNIFPPVAHNPLGPLGVPGMIGFVGNFNLGNESSSLFPLYERFLFSRSLIQDLLKVRLDDAGFDGTLMDHLGIKKSDPTVRSAIATSVVRKRLSFTADKKTVLVTIGYRDSDPKIAAVVVNAALELLDRFDVNTAAEHARARRGFIEGRMDVARKDLVRAEQNLEHFRENNLRISNAPELFKEQTRLQRELEIEQQVYLTLRKEYELALIDEHRNVPVVSVLDSATPPLVASGPSLIRNAGLAGLLGLVFVVALFTAQTLRLGRLVTQFVSTGPGN